MNTDELGQKCTCTAFVEPGCPVHLPKMKLADGTEVTLKAGPMKKSKRVTNFSGYNR